ncbi:MAG: NAD(P)/FAD-dependent oxidoreductase [Thiobacillus sp.]
MNSASRKPRSSNAKPHVLVLGGNFAGLGSAQKIREYAGDTVTISVVDRKPYLTYVPNIPSEVFQGRNPMLSMQMDIVKPLADDAIDFVQADVTGIDPGARTVVCVPSERPGAAPVSLAYDYLVIALGNRLAFDQIEGYAEHGHTVSDVWQGERLRQYLAHDYRGGPIAIGSARFHQGDGAQGLAPYPGGTIPQALAACEGPPVETMLSLAAWLQAQDKGGPENITVFTPADMIAEDAGEQVVGELLKIASGMGFGYRNKVQDISRITADGIEFANGDSMAAELKIIFPDWVPHAFLKHQPYTDSEGFVVTDLLMRNPRYPEILAAGDAAAVTVPKLGSIGHQQCEIVGRQIAKSVGCMSAEDADRALAPTVLCIGDMGNHQAFYIRSNSWYGGDTQILKMGRVSAFLKTQYKTLFFKTHGKVPPWGLDTAERLVERIAA